MVTQSKPFVIGIAGPTCAGKTTLARGLVGRLTEYEPVLFQLDRYYLDLAHLPAEKRAESDFDAPGALDWVLILRHLEDLKNGRSIDGPIYDFSTHLRASTIDPQKPGGLIIIEGLHALYEPLGSIIDLAVFVDLDREICFERRLARDTSERGRSVESVRNQFETTVWPAFDRDVAPCRNSADLVVSGEDPPRTNLNRLITAWKEL